MKKAFLSGSHFIKLNSDEVRTIKEAIEICQRGDKLASKYLYEIEEEGAIEWVYNIGKNFRRAEMYLKFVLSKSRIYYIIKQARGMKNYSNYMESKYRLIKNSTGFKNIKGVVKKRFDIE